MSGETPKVLLVDDDKDLLQLIAMRLTAAGYDVTAVESGEAALASLAVARPQCVVTDLRLGNNWPLGKGGVERVLEGLPAQGYREAWRCAGGRAPSCRRARV